MRNKVLNEGLQNIYYVYKCFVGGELKYLGMGKGERYRHCNSGKSSCSELNRDFHAGKCLIVEKFSEGLLRSEAQWLETELIDKHIESGIYNKRISPDFKSQPNISKVEYVNILGDNHDTNVIKHVCALAPDITEQHYEQLRSAASRCGLTVYLAKVKGSKPTLILDKPQRSQSDIDHLGCSNWPNCKLMGCGG